MSQNKESTNDDFFAKVQEEYRKIYQEFYSPFFAKKGDCEKFVDLAFNYDDGNSKVRFMIQQLERFVSLANDIDKIRPARDPLRIFFLKICLESLYSIEYNSDKDKKKKVFYGELEKCFSHEAEKYILDNFKYMGIDMPKVKDLKGLRKYNEYERQQMTIGSFLRLMKSVRDMVAHEGNYWSMEFFNDREDCPICTDFRTKDDIFEIGKKEELTYNFEANLNYQKFIFYFVEACINYIIKKGQLSF